MCISLTLSLSIYIYTLIVSQFISFVAFYENSFLSIASCPDQICRTKGFTNLDIKSMYIHMYVYINIY